MRAGHLVALTLAFASGLGLNEVVDRAAVDEAVEAGDEPMASPEPHPVAEDDVGVSVAPAMASLLMALSSSQSRLTKSRERGRSATKSITRA